VAAGPHRVSHSENPHVSAQLQSSQVSGHVYGQVASQVGWPGQVHHVQCECPFTVPRCFSAGVVEKPSTVRSSSLSVSLRMAFFFKRGGWMDAAHWQRQVVPQRVSQLENPQVPRHVKLSHVSAHVSSTQVARAAHVTSPQVHWPGQVQSVGQVHCRPTTVPPGSPSPVVRKLSTRRSSGRSLSFFIRASIGWIPR
jgi:hypothetical protein